MTHCPWDVSASARAVWTKVSFEALAGRKGGFLMEVGETLKANQKWMNIPKWMEFSPGWLNAFEPSPGCLLVAGWLKHHTFQGLLSWITWIYPGQNNQLPLGTIPSAQTFFLLFVDCVFHIFFGGLKPETSQSHETFRPCTCQIIQFRSSQ